MKLFGKCLATPALCHKLKFSCSVNVSNVKHCWPFYGKFCLVFSELLFQSVAPKKRKRTKKETCHETEKNRKREKKRKHAIRKFEDFLCFLKRLGTDTTQRGRLARRSSARRARWSSTGCPSSTSSRASSGCARP